MSSIIALIIASNFTLKDTDTGDKFPYFYRFIQAKIQNCIFDLISVSIRGVFAAKQPGHT